MSSSPLAVRLSLARWLGPWGGSVVPARVLQRTVQVDGERPFEAFLYRPERRPVRGAWLIAPGMHFRGAADPRLDRFCRVLAASGFAVFSPFLPDYLTLTLSSRVVEDLGRALETFRQLPETSGHKPALFSISFGSYPAVGVAARHGEAVSRLVLFGGYARFQDIVRFSVSGRSDLFNRPVAFKNMAPYLPGAPADTAALDAAWLEFVRGVWNKPEMKEEHRWKELAGRLAEGLPAAERDLFLVGCGARPGGEELAERTLSRSDLPNVDPDPRGVRCPVAVFHGAADDVIPAEQSFRLAQGLGTTARLTGLYAHGDRANGRRLSALAGEVGTMLAILEALAAPATASTR